MITWLSPQQYSLFYRVCSSPSVLLPLNNSITCIFSRNNASFQCFFLSRLSFVRSPPLLSPLVFLLPSLSFTLRSLSLPLSPCAFLLPFSPFSLLQPLLFPRLFLTPFFPLHLPFLSFHSIPRVIPPKTSWKKPLQKPTFTFHLFSYPSLFLFRIQRISPYTPMLLITAHNINYNGEYWISLQKITLQKITNI